MRDKGRSYEVIKPNWNKRAGVAGITLLIGMLFYFISNFIFFKVLAGIVSLCGVYLTYQALQLSTSAIAFFERGIQIKRPNHALEYIPLENIENYDWEAETEEEVEEDWNGTSKTTTHRITLMVSYEDSEGKFKEVNWTEEYPAGSIRRIRRASERAAELFQDTQEQDDFYDE
ncbi:MAG: hypothetical protein VX619_11085 [bacterium]|nr:hypothetical protein [bacterium]